MRRELKHRQDGSGPCVVCGQPTVCEWLENRDRWPVCPECVRVVSASPDRRAAFGLRRGPASRGGVTGSSKSLSEPSLRSLAYWTAVPFNMDYPKSVENPHRTQSRGADL